MNCKQFEIQLSDWLKGRLDAEECARMSAHKAVCAACAHSEAWERGLLTAWDTLATTRAPRELWPLVEARLAESAALPNRTPVRRWRLSLAGALSAGALCAVFFLTRPGPVPVVTGPGSGDRLAEEPRSVLTMVADMQQLPDPDKDSVAQEPAAERVQHPDKVLYGIR